MELEEAHSAILEFLEHYEFVHTAECLVAEREQQRILNRRGKVSRSISQQLVAAFSARDQDRFVTLWETRVPLSVRDLPFARKLELEARLALAVYPFSQETEIKAQQRKDLGKSHQKRLQTQLEVSRLECEARMASLKRYLEGRAKPLSSDPEYCGLFSLPFCEDPQRQPLFSNFFDENWLLDLEERIDSFLKSSLQQSTVPRLVGMVSGQTTQNFAIDEGQRSRYHYSQEEQQQQQEQQIEFLSEDDTREMPEASSASRGPTLDMRIVKHLYATAAHAIDLLQSARELDNSSLREKIPQSHLTKLMERLLYLGEHMDHSKLNEFEEPDVLLFHELGAMKRSIVTQGVSGLTGGVAQLRNGPKCESDQQESHLHEAQGLQTKYGNTLNDRCQEKHECEYSESDYDEHKSDVAAYESKTAELLQHSIQVELENLESEQRAIEAEHDALTENNHAAMTKPPGNPLSPCSPQASASFAASAESPLLGPLKYRVLKSDLMQLLHLSSDNKDAEKQLCYILQALRWRISRTPSFISRKHVVQGLVDNDILGLGDTVTSIEGPSGPLPLGLQLLKQGSPLVQEYTARFLVHLVTNSIGRAYVEQVSTELVEWLLKVLESSQWRFPPTGDNVLKENVLACIQHLSLSDTCHQELLKAIPNFKLLFERLREAVAYSPYAGEHLAALLLNLVLNEQALTKIAGFESECLESLMIVLSEPELDYLHQYVIGILFALLRNEELQHQVASSAGSDQDYVLLLATLAKEPSSVSSKLRRQLAYIVHVIRTGTLQEALKREEEKQQQNDDDEVGHTIIPEDDDDERFELREAQAPPSQRMGEQLLMFAYHAPAKEIYLEAKDSDTVDNNEASGVKKNTLAVKAGDEEETKESNGPTSPIMKLFRNIPEEMQSKPKLQE